MGKTYHFLPPPDFSPRYGDFYTVSTSPSTPSHWSPLAFWTPPLSQRLSKLVGRNYTTDYYLITTIFPSTYTGKGKKYKNQIHVTVVRRVSELRMLWGAVEREFGVNGGRRSLRGFLEPDVCSVGGSDGKKGAGGDYDDDDDDDEELDKGDVDEKAKRFQQALEYLLKGMWMGSGDREDLYKDWRTQEFLGITDSED